MPYWLYDVKYKKDSIDKKKVDNKVVNKKVDEKKKFDRKNIIISNLQTLQY